MQSSEPAQHNDDGKQKLQPGMLVAQVAGKSMEPAVPDGAYCLFVTPVGGSRQGRTLLVAVDDPETGERCTLKRWSSEKVEGDDEATWRHVRVTLLPNNPAFEPIVRTCEDEGEVAAFAELLEVLG